YWSANMPARCHRRSPNRAPGFAVLSNLQYVVYRPALAWAQQSVGSRQYSCRLPAFGQAQTCGNTVVISLHHSVIAGIVQQESIVTVRSVDLGVGNGQLVL